MFTIILAILATWRLSSLLVDEDGPFEIFARLRHFTGVRYDELSEPYGTNVLASGLLCVWCVSVWIAILFALIDLNTVNIPTFIVNWLAISAGAILFHEVLHLITRR